MAHVDRRSPPGAPIARAESRRTRAVAQAAVNDPAEELALAHALRHRAGTHRGVAPVIDPFIDRRRRLTNPMD